MEQIGTIRNFVYYCKNPEKKEKCGKTCMNASQALKPCEGSIVMQYWE